MYANIVYSSKHNMYKLDIHIKIYNRIVDFWAIPLIPNLTYTKFSMFKIKKF